MAKTVQPLALLLSSVAYFYKTISGIVELANDPLIINTSYGSIQGSKAVSRDGVDFYEFLGIPYATPPIGNLRFEPPLPPEKWKDVRDATRYGSRCTQYDILTRSAQGEEDCLFLNVYSPNIKKPREKRNSGKLYYRQLLPVIVYIHGGLFMSGQSNAYRPKYMMDSQIVLVSFNYRLASFGFLSTGDGTIRGNMGLKDQVLALKWVQENIKFFGGDPERITIMGESAGGSSVHLHMLSDMSKGLFHRGISQSGTALSKWALQTNPKEQAKKFGKKLHCPTYSSKELARCLKRTSARRIARAHGNYLMEVFNNRYSVFSPTIETVNDSRAFMVEHPKVLLSKENISNPVPWINGVNSDEGLIYVVGVMKNEARRSKLNKNWMETSPILFDYENHPDRDNISRKIRSYYLGDREINMDTLQESVNIFSDSQFFSDSHSSVMLQSNHSPVYAYYYTYQGDFSVAKILFSMSGLLPDSVDVLVGTGIRWFQTNVLRREERNYGPCHSDELALFYNLPVVAREILPGSKDYPFSESLIDLWTSFAKDGTPSVYQNVTWDPVDPIIEPVYRLKLDETPNMIEEPFAKRLGFWDSLNLEN